MSGRLRDLARNPIADRDRQRLFWILAAVVVAAAVLLLVTRPGQSRTDQHVARPHATAVRIPSSRAATTRRRARSAPPASTTPQTAAREFLRGYLRLLYGQASQPRLTDATAKLRRALTEQDLVVPPAQRQLRPRVLSLTATRSGSGWQVQAAIADGGVAHYPIILTLVPAAGGRWLVREVS